MGTVFAVVGKRPAMIVVTGRFRPFSGRGCFVRIGEGRVLAGCHVTQVAGEVHDLVISQHHVQPAARGQCLLLQPDQQIHHFA